MDISLSGGILIIGSLLWDTDDIRTNWRESFLKVSEQISVPAPIRYGRISGGKRKKTFTMVLSSECNEPNLIGRANFVPFINNPVSLNKLIIQVEELIKAERNLNASLSDNFNWEWGTVTIAFNPTINDANSTKHNEKTLLLSRWKSRYNDLIISKYKVGKEIPILNHHGILNIEWPFQLNNFDFLIAVATSPNIDIYPTHQEIADRIVKNEYDEYFKMNMNLGISTFQDKLISNLIP